MNAQDYVAEVFPGVDDRALGTAETDQDRGARFEALAKQWRLELDTIGETIEKHLPEAGSNLLKQIEAAGVAIATLRHQLEAANERADAHAATRQGFASRCDELANQLEAMTRSRDDLVEQLDVVGSDRDALRRGMDLVGAELRRMLREHVEAASPDETDPVALLGHVEAALRASDLLAVRLRTVVAKHADATGTAPSGDAADNLLRLDLGLAALATERDRAQRMHQRALAANRRLRASPEREVDRSLARWRAVARAALQLLTGLGDVEKLPGTQGDLARTTFAAFRKLEAADRKPKTKRPRAKPKPRRRARR